MAFGHDVSLEPKWCYQDESFLPSRLCSHCWLHFHSPLGSSLGSHPPRCLPAKKTAAFFNPCDSWNHTDGSTWVTVHSRSARHCSCVPPLGPERSPTQPIIHGVESEKRFTRWNSGCSDPEEEQMCDGWPKQSPAACRCLRQSWRNLWLPWGELVLKSHTFSIRLPCLESQGRSRGAEGLQELRQRIAAPWLPQEKHPNIPWVSVASVCSEI